MPEDGPDTKADLKSLEERLTGSMDALEKRLTEGVESLEERLTERMRDMQAEVLRAFHDCARPVDIRLRHIPEIEERIGLLEERVGRIEGDKQLPPH